MPGENGCNLFSRGAWQVGARYSWIDLNDNGINGGLMRQHTLGLNWYLHRFVKIQVNLIHERIHDPSMGPLPGQPGFWSRALRFQFAV